ncbi:MAG: hypothetical protein H7X94_04115 [Vallitaleaceae bacterium]|nr:hypothetical protein [Vallitaleaceae bacterium]
MKNWIDRYVYAVGEKLPKKQRDDITNELRSAILDALDEKVAERNSKNGQQGEPTEEEVFEVLEVFGSPSVVARQYLPQERYLIGPELFDMYKLVLMITFFAVAIGISASAIVSAFEGGSLSTQIFVEILGDIFSGIFSAVGTVTIVFAAIQHFNSEDDLKKINIGNSWRAKELSPIPFPHNRIKRGDAIAGICFTVLAILVFNLFPDLIAVYQVVDGLVSKIPIFNLDILAHYMLFFNLVWVAQILLHGYNLKLGMWTTYSRLFAIVIDLATVVVIVIALKDPGLISTQMSIIPFLSEINLTRSLDDLMSDILTGIILIVIIATLVDTVKHVVYMIKK